MVRGFQKFGIVHLICSKVSYSHHPVGRFVASVIMFVSGFCVFGVEVVMASSSLQVIAL